MSIELKLTNFFSTYKNKKVIIYGINSFAARIFILFKENGINVTAFCSDELNYVGKKIKQFTLNEENIEVNLSVISFDELLKLNSLDSIIQIAVSADENNLAVKLEQHHFTNYILKEKYFKIFQFYLKLQVANKKFPEKITPFLVSDNVIAGNAMFNLLNGSEGTKILSIMMPTKVGNNTLIATFKKANIAYSSSLPWHLPEVFTKDFLKAYSTIKFQFITAIRDPLAQLLSSFFELISIPYYTLLYFMCSKMNFFENLQEYFDMFVEYYLSDQKHPPFIMSDFYEKYNKHIFDITSQPFNKEAGFTIMKSDNVEVFVYQLEKLNDIYPYLFDWLKKPRGELIKANEADSKIIAEAYKEFKETFTISKEVFNKCYNDPVIQHCYSQEDIEKFKSRWIGHVRQ